MMDWVGIGPSRLFATDGYTAGVAYLDPVAMDVSPDIYLTPADARDLLQFVRPNLKREHGERVELLVAGDELHVGLPDAQERVVTGEGTKSQPLSGVWSIRVPGLSFSVLENLLERLEAAHEGTMQPMVFDPDFAARFSKAKREYGDRMIIQPVSGEVYGAAYVEIGPNFVGAIAGMTYDAPTGNLQPVDPDEAVYGEEQFNREEKIDD